MKKVILAASAASCLALSACGGGGSGSSNPTPTGIGSEQVVYRFAGGTDGAWPEGRLIMDGSGSMYGTTTAGGNSTYCPTAGGLPSGCGTVLKLTPNGSGGYTESILYAFGANGANDGQDPYGGLTMDGAGDLYGTTLLGGANHTGVAENGTVFKLTPNGSGGYTESVLYNFSGYPDASGPMSGLVMDSSGNLYGTALNGGSYGGGAVFKLTSNGSGGYTESVIYSFGGSAGAYGSPIAGLYLDSTTGSLFGVAEQGGGSPGTPSGAVFELAPNGSGGYTESTLYTFTGGGDGATPHGRLTMDGSGNLYGTTYDGGGNGGGTVFKLTPNGSGGYTESTVYSLPSRGSPDDGVVIDASGNLYGTSTGPGNGTVFELSPNGSGYSASTLYGFGGGSDGATPRASVTISSSGNVFGTTNYGGSTTNCPGSGSGGDAGCGVVFDVHP